MGGGDNSICSGGGGKGVRESRAPSRSGTKSEWERKQQEIVFPFSRRCLALESDCSIFALSLRCQSPKICHVVLKYCYVVADFIFWVNFTDF